MNRISLAYKKELVEDRVVANSIGVTVFIILTTLGAYVRIPLGFTPVPITLQTFFVLLAGSILGKRLGTLSQLGYVILGGLGLPVFAGAGYGLCYLSGPTAGYLIGFIICAMLVGGLVELRKSFLWKAFAFFTGLSAIYACGILWLSRFLNIGIYKGALLGLVPFMPAELIKLASAIFIYTKLGGRIKKVFLA